MFTQYLVSLEVENPEGSGPATTVVVMTDEGGERKRKYKYKYKGKYKTQTQNANTISLVAMTDASK